MADTGAMSDADTVHTVPREHEDEHGHAAAGEPLGPIDWKTWAYAGGGSVLGVLVVLALFIARGG